MYHFCAESAEEAGEWRKEILKYAYRDRECASLPYVEEGEDEASDEEEGAASPPRAKVGVLSNEMKLIFNRLLRAVKSPKANWTFWSVQGDTRTSVYEFAGRTLETETIKWVGMCCGGYIAVAWLISWLLFEIPSVLWLLMLCGVTWWSVRD
jgi:hypothetical protein